MKKFHLLAAFLLLFGIFHRNAVYVYSELDVATFEPSLHSMDGHVRNCEISLAQDKKEFISVKEVIMGDRNAIVVGGRLDKGYDHPIDNSIRFILVSMPLPTDEYSLEYELKGVSHPFEMTSGWNDELNVGGSRITTSNSWVRYTEKIHSARLKVGENVLRFNRIGHNDLYELRNIRLVKTKNIIPAEIQFADANAPIYDSLAFIRLFAKKKGKFWMEDSIIELREGWQILELKLRTNLDVIKLVSHDAKTGANEWVIPTVKMNFSEKRSEIPAFVSGSVDAFANESWIFDGTNVSLVAGMHTLKEDAQIVVQPLRKHDMPPLAPGMINVTAGAFGFRLLPDNIKFQKEIKLSLRVDSSLIPKGFGPAHVRTYFFDEELRSWTILPRDSQETSGLWAGAYTNHFTDFVNAIIKAPELPNNQAHVPTAFSGLSAANPLAGVNQISPPSANHKGDLNLAFPIQIPQGRNGMQPSLQLVYNSAGGNGPFGMGWSIAVPSIQVDTRWGVPRFLNSIESEAYLVNGEQLEVQGHQIGLNVQRNTVANNGVISKTFRYRVEGKFDSIVRIGSTPSNYVWRVYEKTGRTYYYGCNRQSPNSPINHLTLKNENGAIAHWSLGEVVDANGNSIKYEYFYDGANPVQSVPMPRKIIYSEGGSNSDYNYHVTFDGWEDRPHNGIVQDARPDAFVDLRYGFPVATDFLITRISVVHGNPNIASGSTTINQGIRTYILNYKEGAFGKKLLCTIGEITNASGSYEGIMMDYMNNVCSNAGSNASIELPLNTRIHRFSYYEYNNSNTPLFSAPQELVGYSPEEIAFSELSENAGNLKNFQDNVETTGIPETGNDKSAKGKLNQSRTITLGGNASAYAGIGSSVWTKRNSLSGAISGSLAHSKTTVGFFDVDGDGYPDRVFKTGNQYRYQRVRKIGSQMGIVDNTGLPLVNLSGISTSVTAQESWNAQAQALGVSVVNFTRTNAISVTTQYFADVDADGYPDLVDGNVIKFNRPNTQGQGRIFVVPTSTTVKVDECNSIEQTGHVDPELGKQYFFPLRTFGEQQLEPDIQKKLLDHNTVSVWVAPRSGTIEIRSLINVREPDYLQAWLQSYANGMHYAIQHNENELINDTIRPDDFNINKADNFTILDVQAGDLIFFRLMSKVNRQFDDVVWKREIIYINEQQSNDADGKRNAVFDAGNDYLPVQHLVTQMPYDGDVEISLNITSVPLSDTLYLKVSKTSTTGSTVLASSVFPAGQNIAYTFLNNYSVAENDQLDFELISHSKVNYANIDINPLIKYRSASMGGSTVVFNSNSEWSNVEITPMFQMKPLGRNYFPSAPRTLANGTYEITPVLQMNSGYTGIVHFSIKENGKVIRDIPIDFTSAGILFPHGSSVSLFLNSTNTYHFCYNFENALGINSIASHDVKLHIVNGSPSYLPAGVFMPYDNEFHKFGTLYRGWGQFVYSGDQHLPIDPMALDIDLIAMSGAYTTYNSSNQPDEIDVNAVSSNTSSTPTNTNDMLNSMNSFINNMLAVRFFRMYVNPKTKEWYASGSFGRVRGDEVFNTNRLSEMEKMRVSNPVPVVTSSITGKAILKKNAQQSDTWGMGLGPSSLRLGGTFSSGNAMMLSDYRDMNGDGYPDNMSSEEIQYTNPRGGLESGGKSTFPLKFNESFSNSKGGNLGGGGKIWKSSTTQASQSTGGAIASIGEVSAGIDVNLGDATNEERFGLFDVNGDGLPDIIDHDRKIRLNKGYGFEASPRDWGLDTANRSYRTNSYTYGGGSSLSLAAKAASSKAEESWAFGVGYNTSKSNHEIMPIDINGDGLLDFLEFEFGFGQPNATFKELHLNLGTVFQSYSSYNWAFNGINAFPQSNSQAININVAGTLGIPITFFKIGTNLSVNGGFTINRDRSAFVDVNNDGFVDYVEDDPTRERLMVRYNNIGKANLLKTVELVTGATYEFNYENLTTSDQMPKAKWLFTKLIVDDKYAADGNDKSEYSYSYHNPNYNRFERVFLGFDSVNTDQWHPSGSHVMLQKRERFHNENVYFTGLKFRETMVEFSGGAPIIWSVNYFDYRHHGIDDGQLISNPQCAVAYYPALFKEEMYQTEGSASQSIGTRKVYHRGKKGVVVKYDDYGDLSDGTDDYTALISYVKIPNYYIYGLPSNISIREGLSSTGNLLRERDAYYNTNGNMTGMRVLLSNTGGNAVYASDSFEYDIHGNVVRHYFPANVNGERYFISYEYDALLNMYPVRIWDKWDLESTFEYEYRNGKVVNFKDAYDQVSSYHYDEYDNLARIVGPKEQGLNHIGVFYTVKYTYSLNDDMRFYPPTRSTFWAETKHYDHGNGGDIRTILFTDGLGQEIQTKKSSFIAENAGSSPIHSWIISGWRTKDERGRVVAQWHPTTLPIAQDVYSVNEVPDQNAPPTQITYDFLNRVVRNQFPDGTEEMHVYTLMTMNGMVVRSHVVTDDQGNSQQTISDVTGLTLRNTRNGTNTTKFEYSVLGELIGTTDPENHRTSYVFDFAGRMTRRNHPDAGIDQISYDPAGNVVSKQRNQDFSNGTTINYNYDFNRLISIEYPTNGENNVYYEYGGSGSGLEEGRVKRIEDATGAHELAYGTMGELIRKTSTFVDLNQLAYTFSNFWEYDSWGRIRRMVYPDGEEVTYAYDAGGQLVSISSNNGDSYLNNVLYDKFENKVKEELGNGTEMLFEYSPDMRRLTNLKAKYQGTSFLNVTYDYDDVGNIIEISNSASSKDNIGGAFTHTYTYDNLYRLATANGSANSSNYTLNMAYSPSGNILGKTVVGQLEDINIGVFSVNYTNQYSFHQSKPHQITGITDNNSGSSFNFEWDLNGNMTLHTEMVNGIVKQRRLCWDEENRLLLAADEEQMGAYLYDAGGMRTHKAAGTTIGSSVNGSPASFGTVGSMTLYPSELITVSSGMYTKHYYAGSSRIASRIGGGFVPHKDLNDYSPVAEPDRVDLLQTTSYEHKAENLRNLWARAGECMGVSLEYAYSLDFGSFLKNTETADGERYFYHSDHLGSSAYITTENGYATQFLAYMPYGETLAEQQNGTSYYSPFKFSAKEKDPETGYCYFGARYYSPELSVWLSIDPMADKRPWLSAYNYCQLNPVMRIDPTGMLDGDFYNLEGQWLGTDGKVDNKVYLATCVEFDNDGLVSSSEGTKTLNITHSEFRKQASTVYGESSAYKNKSVTDALKKEMYAIASVHQSNKLAYGANSDKAKEYLAQTPAEINRSRFKTTANAAVINALIGGFDYSFGATMWDGREQALFPFNDDRSSTGKFELHMNTMGWSISDAHYETWKANVGTAFQAPQAKAAPDNFGKYSNKGMMRLNSTAVYGQTIFWRVD